MSQHRQLFSSVSILLILFVICVCNVVNSENITDGNLNIWSSLLEQYTIGSPDQSRQAKYLQKQFSSNGRVYITRRIGEAYEPNVANERQSAPFLEMQPPPVTRTRPFPQIMKRIDNQPTKPANFRPNGGRLQPTEISETDLYLLGAIEKLVYRVDYLEKRLKKTDELVLYLMEKSHQIEQASATNQQNQINQKPTAVQQPAILNTTHTTITE